MPSKRPGQNGLKIPHRLQQELGLDLGAPGVRNGKRKYGTRKDQRKANRVEKKAARVQRPRSSQAAPESGLISSEEDGESATLDGPPKRERVEHPQSQTSILHLKSILKKTAHSKSWSPVVNEDGMSRESSPELVLDGNSRAFRDRALEEDAEIAALEKKLGLKNMKLPKSFEDDGLADLLEGLDSSDDNKKRKREGDDWLRSKRRKAEEHADEMSEDEHTNESAGLPLDGADNESDTGNTDDEIVDISDADSAASEDDFTSFSSDEDGVSPPPQQRVKENPYVPPVSTTIPAAKYVPPSLRKQSASETQELQRLRRQIRGHLNKLSEANLISILKEIEQLYQSHARQDVTSTLKDLLLFMFCDRSALQTTFVILHAAFIAALYKVIGTDFGAEVIVSLAEKLDSFLVSGPANAGKESANLVSLLSYLFAFHVVSSKVVFDYVRLFLAELNENNAELLLRVVRDCGPQLRQDDPTALKSIVQMMQNAVAKHAAEGGELSVRAKFMTETIIDLKNNKLRASTSSVGIASEHLTQMRKVLGSLNSRNLRASEPMRIGLDDIKNSDRKGKWWLVGASWKGNIADTEVTRDSLDHLVTQDGQDVDAEQADLLALAQQYHMNTAVRRAIFVAVMSATDYQDAHMRLQKLRLKRSQEEEVPKVLLRCGGAEQAYNPYYTLIAKKLCTEKKMKMAFQFSLWDFFKKMGERGDAEGSDDDDGDGDKVKLSEIVNIAKMYGQLIADSSLSITVLKTLDVMILKEQAKMFLELLLIVIVTPEKAGSERAKHEKRLRHVFGRATDTPQLSKGLQHFIRKNVSRSDLAGTKEERRALKAGCKIALDSLSVLSASDILEE